MGCIGYIGSLIWVWLYEFGSMGNIGFVIWVILVRLYALLTGQRGFPFVTSASNSPRELKWVQGLDLLNRCGRQVLTIADECDVSNE